MLTRRSTATRISLQITGLLLVFYVAALLLVNPSALRVPIGVILSPLISLFPAAVLMYAAGSLLGADHPYLPRAARAWSVMGLGLFLAAVGDLLALFNRAQSPASRLPGLSFVTPADVFFLAACPVFLLGVMLLPAPRQTRREGLTMGLDLALVTVVFILADLESLVGAGAAGIKTAVSAWDDFLLLLAVFWLVYHAYDRENRRPVMLLAGGAGTLVLYHLTERLLLHTGAVPGGALIEMIHAASSLLLSLAGAAVVVGLRLGSDKLLPADRQVLANTAVWHAVPYLSVLAAYGLLLARSGLSTPVFVRAAALLFGVSLILLLLRYLLAAGERQRLEQALSDAGAQLRTRSADLERANQSLEQEIIERRSVEARLSYDVLHDGLTGLPNRALFIDRLEQAVRKKKRNAAFQFAVLYLDIDSFKVMNDSLGHPAGDQLLVHTARTLLGCVRATDTVARLGGDEFAILLEDVGFPEGVILTAKRLLADLNQPVVIDDARVVVSASIGLVQCGEGCQRPEDILRDADLAMYQAKSRGRGRFEVFQPGLRESAISRMALESDLRSALENNEFTLWYQPILKLPNHLVGFEALVRWQHPARGLLAPAEFIPLAEETGMILPLGEWILERACRQAVDWLRVFPSLERVKMSVNISGIQLRQPDFVHSVVDVLGKTHLPPERLALEVTESVCLDGLERVAATLRDLQVLGTEVHIDDFGTGYSALSYLQRLPVYTIKIDRSFIHDLSGVGGTSDIVRAIFSMVNHLGIKAVAEGIENQAQLDALRRLNCHYVQGFLLARPMDAVSAERWLVQNTPVIETVWTK